MCLASAVGFLLLTVAFLACGIGFLAPYWVYFPGNMADKAILDKARAITGDGRIKYDGMLGRCFAEDDCVFFFQNNFEMEKEVKDWHKAAQALYSFGYVILLSTLLLAMLHLCCRFCCHRPFSLATVIGSLIIAGSVLVGASIGIFMAFQMKENGVILGDPRSTDTTPLFYWGCLVAAGGVLCALLSSLFFICEGCRPDSSRSYDGYDSTRTV